MVSALFALLCAACGGGEEPMPLELGETPDEDEGSPRTNGPGMREPAKRCDTVRVEGDVVVEEEKDFTARYRMGEPYTRTFMIFGGEPVQADNVLSNAYIVGLDQSDAQMLAERYTDFHLCSSPGGQEASNYIVPYDLVPATCEIQEQLVAALQQYDRNLANGGDRTSLRIEGAPLTLESVIEDATGVDATDQISGQDFHLVTAVEQLSGESLLEFGNTD